MAEVFRRADSDKWWFSMVLPDGTRLRRSTKRTKKTEAKAVALAFRTQALDRHQLGILEEMTLQQAAVKYLEASIKNRGYIKQVSRCKKLLGDCKGKGGLPKGLNMKCLTPRVIGDLRVMRLKEGDAENTIDHEMKLLSAIYHMARDTWGIAVPSVLKFPKFNVKGALRYLSMEEEQRLLQELSPQRVVTISKGRGRGRNYEISNAVSLRQFQDNYDLVITLLDTGTRYSEAANLLWSDIDCENWRSVEIFRSKVGNQGVLRMTNRLREVLKRRREADPMGEHVFAGYAQNGKTAPRGSATKAIRRAIERAGLNSDATVNRLGRVTAHTLRHTFASRLVQNGASLFDVQYLLGHSDPRMTQRYAHLVPSDTASKAADILDMLHDH